MVRGEFMDETLAQVPVTGSYAKAMERTSLFSAPPATSTVPLRRRVAGNVPDHTGLPPVSTHLPVTGSYSSAAAVVELPMSVPPTTKTLPLGSNVALWSYRPTLIEPVGAHVPLTGSYSSAVESQE